MIQKATASLQSPNAFVAFKRDQLRVNYMDKVSVIFKPKKKKNTLLKGRKLWKYFIGMKDDSPDDKQVLFGLLVVLYTECIFISSNNSQFLQNRKIDTANNGNERGS